MRLLALTACTALIACDASAPAQEVVVEIRADRAVYDASADLRIQVAAVNLADRPVYYVCNGFQHVLERREEDDWTEIGAWYTRYAFYCDPVRLEPGSQVADIPPLTEPRVGDVVLTPGTYRIRSEFYEDAQLTALVATAEVVSVPFEIR